jgi:antitoxin FitA
MNITVKNIPVRLHQILKKKAQIHHRSLNSEIIVSLSSVVGLVPMNVETFLDEVRHIQNGIKGKLTDSMIDQAKREGRE